MENELPKKKIASLVLASVLLCLCGGFVALVHIALQPWDPIHDIDMTDPAAKGRYEAVTQLTFPPSIVWENVQERSWLDLLIASKFRVSRKDLNTMFEPVKIQWSETERTMTNSRWDARWFKPDSIVKFRSGTTSYPTERDGISVLYDNSSDPDDENAMVLVYMFHVL